MSKNNQYRKITKYFFKIKINFRIIGKSNNNLNKHFINQNSFNQIWKKFFKIFIILYIINKLLH